MSKLAVVTGGTKGIGRAIIDKFASAGFDIATCSRNSGDLESLSKMLTSTYPIGVESMAADLSNRTQAKAFTDFVSGLNRPVDVLVNNAGYFAPGLVTEEPEGSLELMVGSNLYSAYYTTRGLVGGMKKRRSGHIFNMCSIASIEAYPNGGSYAISKFALRGFSKVLREELKEFGVRVTSVLPGPTRTSSWDAVKLPEERFMKPEDVEMPFSELSPCPREVW